MLEKEQIFARNQLARLLSLTILLLLVALELPVVVCVALAIVTVPTHFLPLADGGGFALRRVQILASLIVFEANQVSAANRLTRPTGRGTPLFSLSHCEQSRLVVLGLRFECHDLLSRATAVVGVD